MLALSAVLVPTGEGNGLAVVSGTVTGKLVVGIEAGIVTEKDELVGSTAGGGGVSTLGMEKNVHVN